MPDEVTPAGQGATDATETATSNPGTTPTPGAMPGGWTHGNAAPVAPASAAVSNVSAPAASGAPSAQEPPDPNWLNTRIAKAKNSAANEERTKLLKELGVESIDAAKSKIAEQKKLEDEKKTEIERANERVKALEPEVQRARKLAEVVAGRAAIEMGALTEAQQEAVKGFAGDDPAAQLETIDRLKKASLLGTSAPATASANAGAAPASATTPASPAARPVAQPASTTNAGGAPRPASATTVDHKAVYTSLQQTNPMAAAHYAQRYERELFGG